MRIQASTRLRSKGDIRNDKGVGRIALTAEDDNDREFLTAIYRIIGDPDSERQEQGVAAMRRFLSDFPDPLIENLREQRRSLSGEMLGG